MSSYFQFADPLHTHLEQREQIVKALPDMKFLIRVDVNTKSKLWFSDIQDSKGVLVEGFILQNDFLVQNVEGQLRTYRVNADLQYGFAGANIDITVTKGINIMVGSFWMFLKVKIF